MIFGLEKFSPVKDLRARLTLTLGIAGLVFLAPFAVNNFVNGRFWMGVGALSITAIMGYHAWSITRGRYYPLIASGILAPLFIIFLALAILTQGMIGYLWSYPVTIVLYFMLPERQAWIANAILLPIVLPGAWHVFPDSGIATRAAVTFLTVSAFSVVFVRVMTDQQERLEKLVVTDNLTGLLNRASLQETLEQAIFQNSRSQVPMTIVSLDLDRFKVINDTLGHASGDIVLRGVGRLMNNRIRRTDKVFRLGGEEFLVLLYGTGREKGLRVAEELREAIATASLLPNRPVTASIGVATLQPNENWSTWMNRSDESLYQAKRKGRNRVVASELTDHR